MRELSESEKERERKEKELIEKSRELGLKRNYPHLFVDEKEVEQVRLQEIQETKKQFMDNLRERVVAIVEKMELNEEKTSYILDEFQKNVWESVEDFFRQVSKDTEERIKNYKRKAEEMTNIFKKEVDIFHKLNQQGEVVIQRFLKESEKTRQAYEEYVSLQKQANEQIEKYNQEILDFQKVKQRFARKLKRMGHEVIGI